MLKKVQSFFECPNHTRSIEKRLSKYHGIAREQGVARLRLICEPTGDYQTKLLRRPRTPPPTAGVIPEKNLALLFAETGPLGDSAFYFKICISLRSLR